MDLKNSIDKTSWISPNFGERRAVFSDDPAPISFVILHYTGMENAAASLERLCDPVAEVSAHYVIDEIGSVFQLVPESKRAWHAGVAMWRGLSDINSLSIGIEIVNKGHEFGYHDFPEMQMRSVRDLCLDIKRRYGLRPDAFLAHSDVAPERKADPGERFDWCALSKDGIGIWPEPSDMDYEAADDFLNSGCSDVISTFLCQYGYDGGVPIEALARAFHRHFYPGVFQGDDDPECFSRESVARLLSLLRQKNALDAI